MLARQVTSSVWNAAFHAETTWESNLKGRTSGAEGNPGNARGVPGELEYHLKPQNHLPPTYVPEPEALNMTC